MSVRKYGCLLMLLMSVLVSGCWSAKEAEHIEYVVALGFDKEGEQFRASAHVLNMRQLSSQKPSGDEPSYWLVHSKGETLEQAAHRLYETAPRRLFWGHIRSIVIGDELLRDSVALKETMDILTRFRDIRYATWMFSTKGTAQEVMRVYSALQFSPHRGPFSEPRYVTANTSMIKPIRLNQMMREMNSPSGFVILPNILKRDDPNINWIDPKAKKPVDSYLIDGGYVIKSYRLSKQLTHKNIRTYLWLTGNIHGAPIVLKNDQGVPSVVVLAERNKSNVRVLDPYKPRFEIKVEIIGALGEVTNRDKEQLARRDIEKQSDAIVREEILALLKNCQEDGIDLARFKDVLYRREPRAYQKLPRDWFERMDLEKDLVIDVKTQLKRDGMVELHQR